MAIVVARSEEDDADEMGDCIWNCLFILVDILTRPMEEEKRPKVMNVQI